MKTGLAYLRRVSPMQILLLLVLTVALYFAAAFSTELIAGQRITSQASALNVEIAALQAQNKQLKEQVAQASGDAYVERQARDQLGLVRTGDTPVVITNLPNPAPPPPTPTPAPKTHLQKWKDVVAPPPV